MQNRVLNAAESDNWDESIDVAVNSLGEAYGKRSFTSDAGRVAFLFERYQSLASLMPVAVKEKMRGRKAAADSVSD